MIEKNYDEVFLTSLTGPLYYSSEIGKKVKRIMKSDNGLMLREKFPQYIPWCSAFPSGLVILSDGSVSTCCFDPFGRNSLGNVFESDLLSIWKKNVRQVVKKGLYSLDGCRDCIGNESLSSLISDPEDYLVWENSVQGYPTDITIEIMGACNYGCCVSPEVQKYRNTKLDLYELFPRIKSFLHGIKRIRLFNYGEPLLNEGFCDFIENCRKETSEVKMILATNGILMNERISTSLIERKVDTVVVSVHGGPGTENMLKYSRYGADYEKVLQNVKRLIELKKEFNSEYPKISLRAILFNWNDKDDIMDKFREDAMALGLRATGGNPDTDNYQWLLDGASGRLERASKRFLAGNVETEKLIKNGELMV